MTTSDRDKTLIHLDEIMKPEWIQEKRSLCSGGITVSHCIEPPDAIKVPASCHHFLIVMLSHGTRQVTRFNGQEHEGEFQIGEFVLHPASVPGFYSWESTDEALLFAIEPSFLNKVAIKTECLNPSRVEVRDIVKSYCPHLEKIAYSFLAEMQTGGFRGQLYTDYLANLMAIDLLRHQCVFQPRIREYTGGLSASQTKQAVDYIQAHLDEELGLETIADLAGLSQAHFSRKFKISMGVTPHKYVMQQRVEMAKRLLRQTDIALADVATDCGFTHQSHMGRLFKENLGMTPKQYRDEFR